jgi:hypothetical protein
MSRDSTSDKALSLTYLNYFLAQLVSQENYENLADNQKRITQTLRILTTPLKTYL